MRRFVFSCILPGRLGWTQTDSAWTPDFSMRERIAEAVPSPHGRMAAWTRTRHLDWMEKYVK
ncbi:MAG TPA: hypothetical protein VM120_14240 [Bryobacteraceae bacterium]|nr:hypothetical protein [Bryobacteraceae bacterium]